MLLYLVVLERSSVGLLYRLLLSIIVVVSEPLLLEQLFVTAVVMLSPNLEVVKLMALSEDRPRHPHTLPLIPLPPLHHSSLHFHIHWRTRSITTIVLRHHL